MVKNHAVAPDPSPPGSVTARQQKAGFPENHYFPPHIHHCRTMSDLRETDTTTTKEVQP